MLQVDQEYFRGLGARIARRRRELGIVQIELAAELGCSQNTIAHYEAGSRRIPVSLVPRLAKFINVSVDELLDVDDAPKKRGPSSKLQRQLEKISRLPKTKQRFVSEMLDTILEANAE